MFRVCVYFERDTSNSNNNTLIPLSNAWNHTKETDTRTHTRRWLFIVRAFAVIEMRRFSEYK